MKGKEKTLEFYAQAERQRSNQESMKPLFEAEEILSVEWTHRHYVQDDEYIPYGEDIEAFLKREIAKPIIRWEDSPQLGYEILPNKYFYRYQPPTPAKELLAEFWKLEKEAEKMLEGLANEMSNRHDRFLDTLPADWTFDRIKDVVALRNDKTD